MLDLLDFFQWRSVFALQQDSPNIRKDAYPVSLKLMLVNEKCATP